MLRVKIFLLMHLAFFSCGFEGYAYGQQADEPDRISFNRDVRPILSDKCFRCHGPDPTSRAADLRLDLKESAFEDLGGYAAVVPHRPQDSMLMERVLDSDPDFKMPPPDSGKSLTDQEIETLRGWVAQGATWPEYWAYRNPTPKNQSNSTDQDEREWIDRLVTAGLEGIGLKPTEPADPVTLVRRLCFDLTGLPPTPEQVQAFVKDPSEANYQGLVEQLLASPHFGERMAVYWLDLVRYADTVGYHGDQDHNIAPYRDWVINAFNANMPFDTFTREQLAGDLLDNPTLNQQIATGYNRLLQTSHEGGVQPSEYRAIYAADRVRNLSAVWMGATLGCAQCHDHKYDPYTTEDFYAMAAFFSDIDDEQHFKVGTNALPTRRPPEILVIDDANRKRLNEIDLLISKNQDSQKALKKNTESDANQGKEQNESLTTLQKRLVELKAERKRVESRGRWTMVTRSLTKPRVTRVLPRGDWLNETGAVVNPAVPSFLPKLQVSGRASRLDLANWLTDPDRYVGLLTGRVMANRIWYLLMGSGVCRSLDDFGGQGEPPQNIELLDRLGREFVEQGWDVKNLVRTIVSSQTYRQSSEVTADQLERDPYNQWFGRQDRYRLPAEFLRDNILAVSGLLKSDKVGGSSIKPFQPEGYYQHLNFPQRKYKPDNGNAQWRRGLYMHWQRQFLHPTLKSMDAPSREECTATRPRSNTPLAALAMLNDPSFMAAAHAFALRLQANSEESLSETITLGFKMATSRPPDPFEKEILEQLYLKTLDEYRSMPTEAARLLDESLLGEVPEDEQAKTELAAWISVTRALLNLDETITRN